MDPHPRPLLGKAGLVVKGTATLRGWQHPEKFPPETGRLPLGAGRDGAGESSPTGRVCVLHPYPRGVKMPQVCGPKLSFFLRRLGSCLKCGVYSSAMGSPLHSEEKLGSEAGNGDEKAGAHPYGPFSFLPWEAAC